jgi:hypothetical protein
VSEVPLHRNKTSKGEQLVLFKCFDLYHKSPDSGAEHLLRPQSRVELLLQPFQTPACWLSFGSPYTLNTFIGLTHSIIVLTHSIIVLTNSIIVLTTCHTVNYDPFIKSQLASTQLP